MRYNLIMTPKHIKLPDGKIVPVLGWVKDLYRIPGGHIKMKLAQVATEADIRPTIAATSKAAEYASDAVRAVCDKIDNMAAQPKRAGRPRRIRAAE